MSTPLPPELDPRGRHRGRPPSPTRNLRPIGRVVGVLVSVSLLVVAGYAWSQFRDLNNGVSRLSGLSVGRGNDRPDIDGEDQNILVVGIDDRSNISDKEVKELHVGRGEGSLATDTMMIVHVPADGSRATLISLPRDTMVDVPDGYKRQKLNGAYASGHTYEHPNGSDTQKRTDGANLLIKTITELTGLTLNHYVQIDLLGFYRLATAIDGIPVNLCKDVDDRHSSNVAKGDDGGSGLYLKKGHHTLDGLQSLEFVRQRHNLDGGDLDRVKRQQYFLTAAFREVASFGILTKLRDLKDALTRSVYFDKDLDLIDLARQLENLTANKIVGKTIPTYNGDDGMTADPAKVKAFVQDLISPPPAAPRTKAKATAPKKVAKSTAAIDSKCIN